ncbi:MAG: SLBB domain-containing protein [Planctomycetota bacterium]
MHYFPVKLIVAAVLTAGLAGAGCGNRGVQVIKGVPGAGPALVEDTALKAEARAEIATFSVARPPADYRIGIHDDLAVEVWQSDQPALQFTARVRSDGLIAMRWIGDVAMDGKTEAEVAVDITGRIATYIKDPFVTVRVTGVRSKQVYVFGEVRAPGVQPLGEQLRLLDVLLKAGGVTAQADLDRALFIRGGRVMPVNLAALLKAGVMEQNVYLDPDDKILIPNTVDSKVFVFGEVQKPGVIMADAAVRLMDAITGCGGLTPEAEPDGVRIIRGGLADPTVYLVSVNRLIRGDLGHNVRLERGDIVFVPAKGVVHWQRFMERILPPLTDIYLLRNLATPAN